MPASVDTLMSYVAPPVARAARAAPPSEPRAERFTGAAMLVDIAGFTALTDRLAGLGPAGAERLTQLLNAYFGRLVDAVNAHGGEVASFAGDGLLAIWRAETEDVAAVTLRAAQCGLAVQELFRDYELGEGEQLLLRIGVGTGDILAAHVGGIGGRWAFLPVGDPLVQASAAEEYARPGHVVLSLEAWVLVSDRCRGQHLPNGTARLQRVTRGVPPRAADPVQPQPGAEAALRPYIPLAVTARLDAGHTGWLAELRNLTVLFLHVRGLDTTGHDALEQLQRVMQAIQTVLARYEGAINKLLVLKEGAICVAAFGLPPVTHEDDPRRAVQAGLDLRAVLRERGLGCTIGIASGQAFCGPVGGERRREYTMIGDVVNVAARLMQSAVDALWCDAATYQATHDRFRFDALPRVAVKGKPEPVAVYAPKPAIQAAHARRRNGRTPAFVGRTAELDAMRAAVAELAGGRGGLVIVEGEAGIGKSRLVEELLRLADEAGAECLVGTADAVEQATPYHCWRPVFARLLRLDPAGDAERHAEQVRARVQPDAELWPLAPLLGDVLAVELPDNEVTQHMTGKVRADNRHLLLARLFQQEAVETPLLLVLEDAHWMDAASWALLLHVHREVPEALIVVDTRPYAADPPAEYELFRVAPGARHLVLDPLGPGDVVDLVCRRLGVDTMPAAVAALVHERAQGNPFFSEELAFALRDAGYIRVDGRACTVTPEAGDLRALTLPDTVQGVVTSRIDRLTPAQQLALKAASVIGRVFAFRVLRDIYPIEADRPLLQDYLDALDGLDLTPLESPEPDLAYIFKHVITQEVAYNLMLQTQRSHLHRAVAEWYERTHADDVAQFYPLLAHHWGKAGEVPRALDYTLRAGERALENGANRDAVHFFTDALALNERAAPAQQLSTQQQATLARQLGAAHLGLGQLDESRLYLEEALKFHGFPMPTGQGSIAWPFLKGVAEQAAHLALPNVFVGRRAADRERLVEAVRATLHLCEILYFRNEIVPALFGTLMSLNLAERAGPSPELARVYAGSAIFAGATAFRALARRYARLGREHADRVDQLPVSAYVAMATGTHAMASGQYADAHAYLSEAIAHLERLRDHRLLAMSRVALARVTAQQGNFEESERLAELMRTEGIRTDNREGEAWGLIGVVENALRLGRNLGEAPEQLERAIAILAEAGDTMHRLRAHGLLAVVRLRQDRPDRARHAADAALSLLSQAPSAPGAFEGYAGMIEVYAQLWHGGREDVAEDARAVAQRLLKLGKRFPLAEARAYLWWGEVEWLSGRRAAAHRAWKRSLAAATDYGAPYEQALVHLSMGAHRSTRDPDRIDHLNAACVLFERLGARADLERAKTRL